MKRLILTIAVVLAMVLTVSAQGIIIHETNNNKMVFNTTDVSDIEFTESSVEASMSSYVTKSVLADTVQSIRTELNAANERIKVLEDLVDSLRAQLASDTLSNEQYGFPDYLGASCSTGIVGYSEATINVKVAGLDSAGVSSYFCIYYNTTGNPTDADATLVNVALDDGEYSITLPNLEQGTTYYYRLCLYADDIFYYGKVSKFTTYDMSLDSIATGDVTPRFSDCIVNGHCDYENVSDYGIIYTTTPSADMSLWTKVSATENIRGDFTVTLPGLTSGATYSCCAYALVEDVVYHGGVKTFTTLTLDSLTQGDVIDLGLSVKWASHNVGATKPNEYGSVYAWGETETKTEYEWATYFDCTDPIYLEFTKYDDDKKTVLDAEDDVAHVKWGGDWRMPTHDECAELVAKCTFYYTSYNGVDGIYVLGPNGNSIFLPINGAETGFYWTSALHKTYYGRALELRTYGSYAYDSLGFRCDGNLVRPVCP